MFLILASVLSACRFITPSPAGEAEERERARKAGERYIRPLAQRGLPDLETSASLPAVLEYAFKSSGNLEASYLEWRAALERIPQAGALPDPRLDFNFIFSQDNLKIFYKAFTLALSQDLPALSKRQTRAQQALINAQAAAEKFRAEKYRLQKRVVQSYAALALNKALRMQNTRNLQLLKNTNQTALHRFHAMQSGGLPDLSKIEVEILKSESDLRSLELADVGLKADLNGVLGRRPDAPLGAVKIPAIDRAPDSDAALFERAVGHNPELAALRKEVRARGAAVKLAELEKRPEYSVGFGVDSLKPMLSAGTTLPVYRARIRAGIAEAEAMRQSAEAKLRASSADVQARVVISLAGARDAERLLRDFRELIVPKTRDLLEAQTRTYGSGGGDLLEILDTQRLLIEFQEQILRAESDRLRYLAELEEVLGDDLFNFMKEGRVSGHD